MPRKTLKSRNKKLVRDLGQQLLWIGLQGLQLGLTVSVGLITHGALMLRGFAQGCLAGLRGPPD